jgi:hypothetical protein
MNKTNTMAVEIKFEALKGFEEYPRPYVKIINHYKEDKEEWFDWFGCNVKIERTPTPLIDRETYILAAMNQTYSDIFIQLFGDDFLREVSTETIKRKLLKVLEYMDYKHPYDSKGYYEIIK